MFGTFATIFATDWLTGTAFALRALYVLPVGLASWLLGGRAGAAAALVASAACFAFDLQVGRATVPQSYLYSDTLARILTYLGVAFLLARLREAHLQLEGLAHTDSLTGLANKRAFHALGQREIERARRIRSPFTLVSADLDGFKWVNDTRGHAEGDRVLVEVARVLASCRALDLPARLGGDEFALLLPDTGKAEAANRARATRRPGRGGRPRESLGDHDQHGRGHVLGTPGFARRGARRRRSCDVRSETGRKEPDLFRVGDAAP
ncbi:MAG: GGDEF domain-containing protein [Myxococcales bacterium]|nr:GGDEF domain-containing protein [Myxococcales bacterium]